jgi:hypothetical protein
MKVACRPCFWAIAFRMYLKETARSAVGMAGPYSKSI